MIEKLCTSEIFVKSKQKSYKSFLTLYIFSYIVYAINKPNQIDYSSKLNC